MAGSIQQAFQLHQQGVLDQAAAIYVAILKQQPENFDAQQLLGLLRSQQDRHTEALVHLRAALKINAKDPGVLLNTGNAYAKLDHQRDALAHFDRALLIKPHYPEALSNRGNALRHLEQLTDALASFEKALQLKPDFPEALNGQGSVYLIMKRTEDALTSFSKALTLRPNWPEALNNRGIALDRLQRSKEAMGCFHQALSLQPNFPDALNSLGMLLISLGRVDDALACYDKALALAPSRTDITSNRAHLHNSQSRYLEAIADFRKVLELKPNFSEGLAGQAFAYKNICDWGSVAACHGKLEKQIQHNTSLVAPLVSIAFGLSGENLLICARAFVDKQCSEIKPLPTVAASAPSSNRIRLGYLSSDFVEHAVGFQVAELFSLHDRAQFEVTAISLTASDNSDLHARFVDTFEHFIDASAMTDDAVAAEIQARGIDVLIDMNGHTKGARWGILARRPAPVQAAYLGFPGTTGASFIDYVIADPVIAPFDHQHTFTEQIVQLPHTYMVNDRHLAISETMPTRGAMGLPDTGFVFCCFNTSYKITPELFDVWMRLLKAVDGSVLWLRRFADATAANLQREATARGVDPQRLIFAKRADLPDHLARHRLADLFLDTLPFNGHSTACAALWAGLPVLTCLGETFAGRVGASLLAAIDLPELVATSPADYEAKALHLALQPAALADVQRKLEANRFTTPLFDTPGFVRALEAAVTQMVAIRQAGEPPRGFRVPDAIT
jgi:protein O-GlcNAc transferase